MREDHHDLRDKSGTAESQVARIAQRLSSPERMAPILPSMISRPDVIWQIVIDNGAEGYGKPIRAFLTKTDADKVLAVMQEAHTGCLEIIETPVW